MIYPLALLGLAALTYLMTGPVSSWHRRAGVVDHPNSRRQDHEPTPRGAGVTFAVLWVLCALLLSADWNLVLGAALVAVTGYWDDIGAAPIRVRLTLQLAAAVLVAFAALAGNWGWMAVAIVFVVATTNAFNFMDGSNGLAAVQGVLSASFLGVMLGLQGEQHLAWLCAALAATLLGFLPHNFPRARTFMGDSGSTLIGFAIAAIGVAAVGRGVLSPAVPLICVATFLADTGLTLAMRIRRGERWYNSHREHCYQRLIDRGWSHSRVVGGVIVLNMALILPALAVVHSGRSTGFVVVGLAGVLMGIWLIARRT